MSNWFMKTFTGYRIAYCTMKKDVLFIHRPFRSPIIKEIPKSIGGTGLNSRKVIIEEASPIDKDFWDKWVLVK